MMLTAVVRVEVPVVARQVLSTPPLSKTKPGSRSKTISAMKNEIDIQIEIDVDIEDEMKTKTK